ncbi:MAG: membrane or secreted protein [Reichenbachiella sp.]|uniref:membrane or secreted protein n=1 Tax=Reichenbachiella sp. TaxID=2184521 RepID=UPI0032984704
MKKLFLLLSLFLSLKATAQSPIGAWEALTTSDQGVQLRNVLIFSDGYQVLSIYEAESGKFIHSNGGTWKLEGSIMTEEVEFHTDNPDKVGTTPNFEIVLTEDFIQIVGSEVKFKRIDNGSPGALQGAWLMSGRVRDGKTQTRDTTRPRKTMKILSGTRFQWIAYNTETKEFKGTGGGTYTTEDGVYTENIVFFSRDDTKAGLSLKFDYELNNGQWNHKGLSSKGDPIHEIWSVRE